jgi:UDP:flavonoid glycosyltransferase YjiC (YdhE family)
MRVLVSAVPAVGHVIPLLDLARAMQSAGHEIRFATNLECHQLVVAAGLHPLDAGMSSAKAEYAASHIARMPAAFEVVAEVEALVGT